MRSNARTSVAAVAIALCCALGVVGLYLFYVRSERGQQLDAAAFRGAEIAWPWGSEIAFQVLDVISIVTIAAAIIVILFIAIARRRWAIAVAATVVVAGANATTQLLKSYVFTRPVFADGAWFSNSLPSGHTTVAASISFAMLIVVPVAARSSVTVLGVIATCATGISTMIQQWHRPSDVVAAVLVSAGWAALVVAVGGSRITAATVVADGKQPRPLLGNRTGRSSVVIAVLSIIGGLAAIIATIVQIWVASDPASIYSTSARHAAYFSGIAGFVGVTMLGFAVILALIFHEHQPDSARNARSVARVGAMTR